jgi:hypothetical protein
MIAVLAACAACQCSWAQVADIAGSDVQVAAVTRNEPSTRVQVMQTTLPRLEGLDSNSSGPRLDLTVLPRRAAGFGLAVGMSGFQPPPAALGPSTSPNTNFDVGVHWRHTTQDNYQVDVTAWRRVTQPDAYTLIQQRQEPTYMARVEFNLRGSSSGFKAERGFIGMQLEGGARVTLGRKNGGTMLYYRTKF